MLYPIFYMKFAHPSKDGLELAPKSCPFLDFPKNHPRVMDFLEDTPR